MKHLITQFRIKKDSREVVKRAIVEFVDAVKVNESGTLLYESFQDTDGVSFVHLMSFKDENAEQIHKTSSYVKKFVDTLYPNCDEQPVFTELNLVRSNTRS